MHYSLRKFTDRLLVIIAQDNININTEKQLLKLSNSLLKKVPHIPNPNEKDATGASWIGSGYTKLYIWTLVEYDKVFYIDADCLVQASPEDVFTRDVTFAAAPDIFPPDRFNAGVLLIKPSMDTYNDMMTKTESVISYDGGDTGFLNTYFPNWF